MLLDDLEKRLVEMDVKRQINNQHERRWPGGNRAANILLGQRAVQRVQT